MRAPGPIAASCSICSYSDAAATGLCSRILNKRDRAGCKSGSSLEVHKAGAEGSSEADGPEHSSQVKPNMKVLRPKDADGPIYFKVHLRSTHTTAVSEGGY